MSSLFAAGNQSLGPAVESDGPHSGAYLATRAVLFAPDAVKRNLSRVRCADRMFGADRACSVTGTMPNYRRAYVPGGMFFFTLVTERRAPFLTEPLARCLLRRAFLDCRSRWPFCVEAIVLLPDHLHAIWSLPPGDTAYPQRRAWIKKEFTKAWLAGGGTEAVVGDSRRKNRRRGVWQRRFWGHSIRDEDDLQRHVDTIHYNPVKHGLVAAPIAWPYSSFHRFLKLGEYPAEWGGTDVLTQRGGRPIEGAGE